ncbi:AraC family transcriptional regulator [Dyadobacter tibetensis]|uniref:AraC family transcriptional regulator n=1 Tax=Dyadobacter tibetensis TaxID=1211851 RepID=UPI00047042CA|nr:helix-turn-helix domain-containing protein [Dyadobacter tibetensis]
MQITLKNKLQPTEIFRIKRMKEVIKTTQPHGHKDYLEMIYLTEGAGKHHIDFHTFEVKPHSLFFVLPGQIHSWELQEIPKGFVMMFQKDFLLDTKLYDWLFQKFPQPLQNGYDLSNAFAEFQYLLLQIEEENRLQNSHYLDVIQAYVLLLFNKLKRLDPSPSGLVPSALIQSFFSLLNEQYANFREVQAFSDHLNVTAKTLNNACRKFLGKTTSDVISEKVVMEAKRRLLYSDDNLAEIAYELGFTDPSHFNKFFRKQTGVLPGLYRKGIS